MIAAFRYAFLALGGLVLIGIASVLYVEFGPGRAKKEQIHKTADQLHIQNYMKQLSIVYSGFQLENHRPPANAAELEDAFRSMDVSSEVRSAVSSGRFVIEYGTPMNWESPEGEVQPVVVAYCLDPVFDGDVCVLWHTCKVSVVPRKEFEAAPKGKAKTR